MLAPVVGEGGGEPAQDAHAGSGLHRAQDPIGVAEVAPLRVKIKAPGRAVLRRKNIELVEGGKVGDFDVVFDGQLDLAIAKAIAFGIDDEAIGEEQIDVGVAVKIIQDRAERAGQVLFVAIQVGGDVAGGPAQAAVDGRRTCRSLFSTKALTRGVGGEPIEGAVIGAAILHDVLQFDALIGDGGDAEAQPLGAAGNWGSRWKGAWLGLGRLDRKLTDRDQVGGAERLARHAAIEADTHAQDAGENKQVRPDISEQGKKMQRMGDVEGQEKRVQTVQRRGAIAIIPGTRPGCRHRSPR